MSNESLFFTKSILMAKEIESKGVREQKMSSRLSKKSTQECPSIKI